MKTLGNIIWFFIAGVPLALSWFLIGLLWCITIIGIPVGKQCFKFSRLSLFPFGKKVTYGANPFSIFLNILWWIFGGIPIACESFAAGITFCLTIIGIPFGLQCFKIAKLALMPFGTSVN